MAAKFTPRLVELTYEAALKSYWRKEALKKFLRASHISENFLATWGGEKSKRDFLDKVFQKLQASVAVKGFLDTWLVVINSVRRPAVGSERSSRGAVALGI